MNKHHFPWSHSFARPYLAVSSPHAATAPLKATQVRDAYHIDPRLTGAGRKIGIIELGGGFKQYDIDAYFQDLLGMTKSPKITVKNILGATNQPGGDADAEVLLDIMVAGALAPDAEIVVYFCPNTDAGFLAGVKQANADGVDVGSISWGLRENAAPKSWMQQMDAAFADGLNKGVVWFVAAGDNGAADGNPSGRPVADFPASSPHVFAVGGTQLTLNPDGSRADEVTWNDSGATGGGLSTVFARPSYQDHKYAMRAEPDGAVNASPYTGYLIIIDGATQVVGGTSAGAPFLAGWLAGVLGALPAGQTIGLTMIPVVYAHKEIWYDVTKGNNSGFSAAQGYDLVSGNGVIDGAAAFSLLVTGTTAPPPPVTPPGSGPTAPDRALDSALATLATATAAVAAARGPWRAQEGFPTA